jgi:BirA family biotin operon repressor/biotin-[acetyl-CoA-carboxylase] ligase
MADPTRVLRALSDGRFHSGEELARSLGCSRSAVWKHIRRLREHIGIHAVNGRGYRLHTPIELLDRELILGNLAPALRTRLGACHVLDEVDSTNDRAMRAAEDRPLQAMAWFAETQTGGRGRRGRSWHSPYARNLYFSFLHRFDMPMHRLAGLSIAVGVELAEMLSASGLQGHGLKWPNDLHWDGRKLAGILIEAAGEADGPAYAVIGLGLNLDLGDIPDWLDQPVASLSETGVAYSRNRLAATLLARMLDMCERFGSQGLEPFLLRWADYDLYRDSPVRLTGSGLQHVGIARGLSMDGGLRLELDGTQQTFYAGEVSLRAANRDG